MTMLSFARHHFFCQRESPSRGYAAGVGEAQESRMRSKVEEAWRKTKLSLRQMVWGVYSALMYMD